MRGKNDISETEGVGGSIGTGKRLTFLSAKCDYRCTVAACGASRTAVCGGLGRERFTEISNRQFQRRCVCGRSVDECGYGPLTGLADALQTKLKSATELCITANSVIPLCDEG
jgi:hypothetical protein